MKKSEILRGRVLFKRIARDGRRVNGQIMRCSCLVVSKGNPSLVQIGFKVPSKNNNAVMRNRLRRLMREAFAIERPMLDTTLARIPAHVGAIFAYKKASKSAINKVTLTEMRNDIRIFCRAIVSML